jgi:uncharacterized 2Fe-2S/4Fe-4S cluster protein (DUF4445 family)
MADDFPSWLGDRPMVESIIVDLPPPSLKDNTGDLDRLVRALVQNGYAPVRMRPSGMGDLSRAIREFDYRLKAVVGFSGDFWEVLDILPASSDAPLLGVAIDLGTTSIAVRILDLVQRRPVSEVCIQNPQITHGEDILSRILFARSAGGLETLRSLTVRACRDAVESALEAREFSFRNVYALACAGNTTMTHLFLGLDPSGICREPYIPAANTFPVDRAGAFGLDFLPNALLYVFPNVGSYVGGDIVSGIVAAGLDRSAEPGMLVDVGTNAEVVLGNSEWLLACAGAAGPALEGGVVERGMQAADGAIDWVRIDPRTFEASFRVIGNTSPRGICGSGLIDLVAEMFAAGLLNVQGKIVPGPECACIRRNADGKAYVVAAASQTDDGREILISEIDIGIFLKSKAAMYTILSVISSKVGLKFEDLGQIYIAGNFGNRIDPEMAVRIGMIPDLPFEVYRGIGNSSLLGASMALLDRTLFAEVEKVRSMITYVELNVNVELMNQFRGALFLPHTNRRLFPSVRIQRPGWDPLKNGAA